MAISQTDNMSPFSFPNPAVQSQITHPETGDTWIFEDGVWMLADPNDPDGPIPQSFDSSGSTVNTSELEAVIDELKAEILSLRSDIIELRAELQTASVNNFLILE